MDNLKNWWLEKWSGFEKGHPKLAKWIYQIFYFFVFSMGVTIFQYLVFTFMPHLLGEGLAGTEFMWPQAHMELFGVEFTWSLLGYEVLRDMYTLASCDGLVAGLSQVSYAARICKRSRNEKYDIEMILNKGINYHKRYNCPNERRGSVNGR